MYLCILCRKEPMFECVTSYPLCSLARPVHSPVDCDNLQPALHCPLSVSHTSQLLAQLHGNTQSSPLPYVQPETAKHIFSTSTYNSDYQDHMCNYIIQHLYFSAALCSGNYTSLITSTVSVSNSVQPQPIRNVIV